eukprot:1156100-Pelagomonas_calceolata.AAC.13
MKARWMQVWQKHKHGRRQFFLIGLVWHCWAACEPRPAQQTSNVKIRDTQPNEAAKKEVAAAYTEKEALPALYSTDHQSHVLHELVEKETN